MNEDFLLMIPGPIPVHPRIFRAMSMKIMPHRGEEFNKLFMEQSERMKKIFKTKNDVFLMAGSGTAAMDAAIANIIQPGDKVLCITSGKFGERFRDIVKAYKGTVVELKYEWGSSINIEDVKKALEKDPSIKAVTMVHNETSTGVRNPVAEIGKIVRSTKALLVVDTISSLGGDNIEVDNWGIDLCASGSQKCIGLPPGMCFISVSQRAWDVIEKTDGTCYYLNLKKYKNNKYKAPYTQPVSMTYGLKEALDIIDEYGLENWIKKHEKLAKATREAAKTLGLKLFPQDETTCSNTVTSIKVPEGIDGQELVKLMRENHGIIIAGGQDHLKGKIIRIGHMGSITKKEIIVTMACLQMTLKDLGYKTELAPILNPISKI
ncbi:MAG: phosphoserine aminotransferase [Candidatus Methanofastidiosum methylothiophilum]|jgi:aspartate aminotransferase-like enzyme|uniref:Phosphoserine aminotransferase n=1 Tax=Candidatus Methanofastidiosum methylothiophilum TaxID=1705564 RepID=A0A150JCH9_9EURY|nr:MAG: phosphoserine aminotransferase [Candidatus Methanofastidiosum methylthiophilus]MBP6932335.1 alanine--glyoxylate aminotransferase family protein [Methanofastidiosum sp.]OQC52685.1 MAG: phosphoserine aminotransferase [Euryarchaeota archaeon ADurb.Bin023]KYC56454.1 MAG: phosphoserine aminotransferase [Candidatus Methanofastidiosum methylthiophilus]KYC58301.1 MAG: phosphoserine aminotransferase [Candidatus Methanofastidiosum methylthiophilus]